MVSASLDDQLASSVELAFRSKELQFRGHSETSCPTPLTSAHAHVSNLVARTMAHLLRRSNETAHFTMWLPPELFAQILTYLGPHDRFNASYVCHRWRDVATSFPNVWTDLSDFGLASPRLALALGRGKTAPVHLGFMVRRGQSGRILRHLRANLHRVVELQMSIDESLHKEMCDALSTPAPVLRQAGISLHDTYLFAPRLRRDIFAGSAQHLRALTLTNVGPSLDIIPGLENVQSLHVVADHALAVECALFLATTSNLQVLELDIADVAPSRGINNPLPPTSLSSLRQLNIVHGDANLITALLRHSHCPRVMVYDCYTDGIHLLLGDLGARFRLVLLQLEQGAPTASVTACDEAGCERIARCWSYSSISDIFAPHITSHLTTLVTEAFMWRQTSMRHELPQLSELQLTLYVATVDSHTRSTERLPLCFLAPKLATLKLRAHPVEKVYTRYMGWESNESDVFMRALAPLDAVNVFLDGIVERFISDRSIVQHD